MKGWNLDYQALEADYRAKHPNYNRNRVCTVCGGHFASGCNNHVANGTYTKGVNHGTGIHHGTII